MLSVPDQYAGQTLKCPHCSGSFTVPPLPGGGGGFTAAPPAGFEPAPATGRFPSQKPAGSSGVRLGYEPPGAPAPAAPPPPPAAGHSHAFSLSLRIEYLNFLAPLALFIVFVLMFFPWLDAGVLISEFGTFSGWQTAFGEHSSIMGTLHALLFILTLLAAIGAAMVPYIPLTSVPPAAQKFLPLAPAAVGLGAFLCLMLLLVQVATEFGPEPAARTALSEVLLKNREVSLNFFHTFWLRLAVFCEILAIAGCLMTAWLKARGPQAPPRFSFTW
jgi:hypothetical protein